MKIKFTIEAMETGNAYRVIINGTRSIEFKSSSLRDMLIFMITQALANTVEDYVEVFSHGGGTFYMEYIPDTYDNTVG